MDNPTVQTPICCGRRILVFLAAIMPLDERSGVNLQGAFNTAHSTPVEDVPEVGCARLCCKGPPLAWQLGANCRRQAQKRRQAERWTLFTAGSLTAR